MSFAQTRPQWSFLAIKHSTIYGENKTQHIRISPYTECQVSGGGVMILAYFVATGLGHLVVNESTMNSSVC